MKLAVTQVIGARVASGQREDWTETAAVLEVAALAEKVQDRAARNADAVLTGLRKAIAATEQMLRAPITTAGSTPLSSEIATHVRSLDAAERMKLMETATRKGDVVTMTAILSRPAYLVGLTDEQQRVWTEQFNRARFPEETKRLELMKAAADKLVQAGAIFMAQVEAAAGVKWPVVQQLREKRKAAQHAFAAASGARASGQTPA
jgi:hypothetical protein